MLSAGGPPQRIGTKGNQHLPGDEVWLVREERGSDERKYYLTNLPADATLKQMAATIKARWICEQAHQQMKEELGLDHFEGRSWTGLHRHAPMTMIAYAILQSRRLTATGRKKGIACPPPQSSMPAIRQAILDHLSRPPPRRCPYNGKIERMNRTILDATVERCHYDSHEQLRAHLADFVSAYNFGRRLKTLRDLTPYETICKAWPAEPSRFRSDPLH